jgi:hypothetical protein
VLVAAVVVAALVACSDWGAPSAGRWGSGVYVPKDWAVDRAVSGHRVHVVKNEIACAKCHSLEGEAMGPVTPARCIACHAQEGRIEHASHEAEAEFGPGAKADCTACHAFTFEGTDHEQAIREAEGLLAAADGGVTWPGLEPFAPGDCKRCHVKGQAHDELAKMPAGTPLVTVHASEPCLACHKPHEDQTPQSAPCTGCHRDVSTRHAAQGKTATETCQTCHRHQHAQASEALGTCVSCHATHEPVVPPAALFEGGHTQCVGCHRPHRFERSEAVPCRSCHENLNVIGGSRIPAHESCTSCHAPHDVKASPAAACPTCHRELHPDHPRIAGAGTCQSCHEPHPARVTATVGARACSACHQQAASDHGFHENVACTSCHRPHHFELEGATSTLCAGCHAARVNEVAGNPGHRACEGCHRGLPHHPETLGAACEQCHAREQGEVIPAHARCTQCHEPHSGAQTTACSSCHEREHRTAPAGHQQCTQCHEPHTGGHAVKDCAACHAGEAHSPHGQLQAGCLTCHRPHGPDGVARPPACTSCHALSGLPALHALSQHQTCTQCHAGHGDRPGLERATCLGCHTDRANHFPNAPRCANCHLFTKT